MSNILAETEYRTECREMAELSWSTFLSFAEQGNRAHGEQAIASLDQFTQARAAELLETERPVYLRIMEEERSALFREYRDNPKGLKKRLAVNSVEWTPPGTVQRQSRKSHGLGEVAVKTAVKAGIWATVFSLFR